jgi:hypothetical protein
MILSLRFSRAVEGAPNASKRKALFRSFRLFSGRPDSEAVDLRRGGFFLVLKTPSPLSTVKKKRELFSGLSPTSRSSFASPQKYPRPGSGMLTRFPFEGRRGRVWFPPDEREEEESRSPPPPDPPARRALRALNRTDFPYPLGPTDPRPTAVRAEPFSASAFKVLV